MKIIKNKWNKKNRNSMKKNKNNGNRQKLISIR